MLVEIVVPVHNEQAALAVSVRRLRDCVQSLPFPARVVIADSASTDGTPRQPGARQAQTGARAVAEQVPAAG